MFKKMLAVLLANTVFYKAKKRLLTRNDTDGRRFIICYIHHQDGQKHGRSYIVV